MNCLGECECRKKWGYETLFCFVVFERPVAVAVTPSFRGLLNEDHCIADRWFTREFERKDKIKWNKGEADSIGGC